MRGMAEYKEIDINRIAVNENLKYHLHTDEIKNYPYILPVLIFKNEDEFILVDGFLRYNYLRNKNVNKISILISDKIKMEDAFWEGIIFNNSVEALSIVEQILILKILKNTFNKNYPELEKDYNEILQIPLKEKFSSLYNKIFSLNDNDYYFLFSLKPSFKQVQQLFAYPVTIIKQLMELYEILPFKIKDGLFFLDHLFRLAKSNNELSPLNIIRQIINEHPFPNLTHDKKLLRLKQKLQEQNFPHLFSNRKKIQKLSREINEQGFQVKYDNNFEKNDISLTFNISSKEGFEKSRAKLQSKSVKEKIEEILNILKEG